MKISQIWRCLSATKIKVEVEGSVCDKGTLIGETRPHAS